MVGGPSVNLVERVEQQVRGIPVFTSGGLSLYPSTTETAPDSYGDYLATSNDVYSTAWLRAKMLAKLPWQAYRPDGSTFDTHPILSLLDRPNRHFTGLRFKAHVELCMAIWGQAYVTIERDTRGVPREMWPVKPSLMTPITHPSEFITGYHFLPPSGGAPIRFDL